MSPKIQLSATELTEETPIISKPKSYWFISTKGGIYFESFYIHNYVAIEYDRIPLFNITNLKQQYEDDNDKFLYYLKNLCICAYPEESCPGLVASQLSRFLYELKKDDTVLISSGGSKQIAYGRVLETSLMEVTGELFNLSDCPYMFRRPVEWSKVETKDNSNLYSY
jgi:hypothetical protein